MEAAEGVEVRVERALAPYGHFIALGEVPRGSQAFGVPEMAMVVNLVMVWAAQETVAGALREWGSRIAAKFSRGRDDDDALHAEVVRLRDELDDLVTALSAGETPSPELLARARATLAELPPSVLEDPSLEDAQFDRLVAILRSAGLPSRAASRAADQIVDELRQAAR